MVAEALGEQEERIGKPLVGPTGDLWNRIVSRTEDPETGQLLTRDAFRLSNVLQCRPPGNVLTGAPYEAEAIRKCAPLLKEVIREFRPRAILTLGNQPLRWFTGLWGIEGVRGYVFEGKGHPDGDLPFPPVIGSYHPSYIMRGKMPLARVLQMDILKALYVARHGVPRLEKSYTLNPGYLQVWAFYKEWVAAGRPLLAADIETPYARQDKDEGILEPTLEDDASYTILRISFAFAPGKAITMPWSQPYVPLAIRMLDEALTLTFWNGFAFDIPRLRANGATIPGRVLDGMDAFHFLEPSFPMGLKFAATLYCPDMPAWKLAARETPEWYSCADSDVLLRCVMAIRTALEAQGRWATFERHYVDLRAVLDGMTKRGVNVDPVRRKERREEFEGDLLKVVTDLQPLVPREVLPVVKIFKSPEDRLRKGGKWEEGKMVLVEREEKEKPPKPPKVPKTRGAAVVLDGSSETEGKSPLPSKSRRGRKKKTPNPTLSADAVVELPPPSSVELPPDSV